MLLEPWVFGFPAILEDVSIALGWILGLGLQLIRTLRRTLLPAAIRELGNTAGHVIALRLRWDSAMSTSGWLPARAAYSHCVAVGRLYCMPLRTLSQAT